MEHSLNVQFAQKYGIEEAIIVHNFYFWLRKNIANEKHLHNGRYWAYNSNNAFTKLFPYINRTKIFRVLKHLEEEGILLKDCFNKDARDRTLWYAFSDSGIEILNFFGYDMVDFKMANCIVQNETTIPDNKHTDNNKEKEIDKSISKKDELFEQCWLNYRRKGSKKKSLEQWKKLSNEEKEQTKKHILAYIESVSDVKYQKDFERYLRDKCFLNVVYKDGITIFDAETPNEPQKEDKIIVNGVIYR